MVRAGVVGSTGYAGYQLSVILSQHKNVSIVFLSSHSYSNMKLSDVYGNLTGILDKVCIDMQTVESKLTEIDVLFLALPHGQSFDLVEKALSAGVKVIDIGADYRLRAADVCGDGWFRPRCWLAVSLDQGRRAARPHGELGGADLGWQ